MKEALPTVTHCRSYHLVSSRSRYPTVTLAFMSMKIALDIEKAASLASLHFQHVGWK
jgi:hypothetical protein